MPLCATDVGVIISGVIILTVHSSKRFYADPAVALVISIIIFSSAIPLSKQQQLFQLPYKPYQEY